MRCISESNEQVKVEGHVSLRRDMSSHAIVNNDDDAYNAYMLKRQQEKKQRQEFLNLKSEVAELKNDIKDIKELLTILVKANQ